MAAHQHVGAAAPGPGTPIRDKADVRSVGRVEAIRNSGDCNYADPAATAIARAALLGIAVTRIGREAWLLNHAGGADIGVVRGSEALQAAVDGFQQAHNDVLDLIAQVKRRSA